jgi:hypothetical protein
MVQYIPEGISRASFKYCLGDKLREKMEWLKGMTHFSVHFNVHTPIQIGFLNNFENCLSPFKNETLHKESFQDR